MSQSIRINDIKKIYATMLNIRLFEERIVALYPEQEMRTPVHLCLGQEAIAAGVCFHLGKEDYLFTTHRCHGHCIAKGMDMAGMMAEFYGKKSGSCGGKGGSMHLVDPACGIVATSAIVGGGIPLAVGAALGIKLKKEKRVAVVFFGDGATDEGVFYESLNFAALKKLPVLFVCENNFYATNSPQKARQPLDNIFKRGEIFGIRGYRCDGNDALKVWALAGSLLAKIRQGKGPFLLECRTYRWKGHVGPDCDAEKGCRPKSEVAAWLRQCPLKRLEMHCLRKKILTQKEIAGLRSTINEKITEAVCFAKNSPFPEKEDVCQDVIYRD